VQRRLLGLLFTVLAVCLALVAVTSAIHGGPGWVVAFAAAVLAAWMGDLARRALVRRRV
jgi:phosphatidylserine synthase